MKYVYELPISLSAMVVVELYEKGFTKQEIKDAMNSKVDDLQDSISEELFNEIK
ncbi:hypothetical protein D3C79_515850 [compost metagenome]